MILRCNATKVGRIQQDVLQRFHCYQSLSLPGTSFPPVLPHLCTPLSDALSQQNSGRRSSVVSTLCFLGTNAKLSELRGRLFDAPELVVETRETRARARKTTKK
mmetsp:Transcript_9705/g.58855  ORF Transcript_9705/g.58855 Transcript_9705/m.58855 type:complete len:104 (+) Transcript_9705:2745-3056(+)